MTENANIVLQNSHIQVKSDVSESKLSLQFIRASIQQTVKRLSGKSREISKPRDWML